MSSPESSLDERIWAYIRGEGGQVERKKLEAEVSSDPAAARRYATIKLTFQRQVAHGKQPAQAAGTSPHRAKPGRHHHATLDANSPPKTTRVDLIVMLGATALLGVSLGMWFGRENIAAAQAQGMRDGVQFAAACLAAALAVFARQGRVGALTAAAGCIAASCAAAAMLVR